ncbi:hypothetical protein [Thermicanus aegyptius]|uniref:hypothetical protein n=1 Tax=Thermicanus aegyptius TaxID=94009 RepID=UPI000412F4DD|nr:hypothetical protein [Thermicanus aegyptius]
MSSIHYFNQSAKRFNPGLFHELVQGIKVKHVNPVDSFHVTALLESMGWTDELVQERFRVSDLFQLGEEIKFEIDESAAKSLPSEEKKDGIRSGVRIVKSFLRGLIFSLPMAISVLSMLYLKFSLWSYEFLSIDLATAIAIGTILSFIVVGGFTQAIARYGFFYIYHGYYRMARRSTFFFIRAGYLISFLVTLLLFLINMVFNVYPFDLFIVIVFYFFFLNLIWLSVTVMYILQRELLFTGLIIFGIMMVYLFFVQFRMDIIVSQLIAIGIVSLIGLLIVIVLFYREERKKEKGIAPKMPRLSFRVYSVMPYFLYGFYYFSFLFVDRVMAWSAVDVYHPESSFMPYFIWFRGDYELGLDFALLALMLPLGMNEAVVQRLMHFIERAQKSFLLQQVDEMRDWLWKKYKRMIFATVGVSILSALTVFFILLFSNQLMMRIFGRHLITDGVTYFVFIVAVLSYVILSVALLNAVLLFAVSQAKMVNQALVPALFINMILGFLLSRWVSYEYAVFGLLAGSLLFLILSFRSVKNLFRKVDFYLYAIL